jgi:hypothetical protein
VAYSQIDPALSPQAKVFSCFKAKWEWGLACFFLVLHFPFVHWQTFGEPDQARFIIDALQWDYFGEPVDLAYRAQTSPLYILLLHGLTRCFILGTDGLIALSAGLSLIATTCIVPLFLRITTRLGFPFGARLTAIFLLESMPLFWNSSHYGFPTMPSMAILMLSLLTFWNYCGSPDGKVRGLWLTATVVLYIVAGALKIDSLVTGSAYFGILLLHFRGQKLLRETGLLVAIALVGYLGVKVLSARILGAMQGGSSPSWAGTFGTYPILPLHFLYPERVERVLQAFGMTWWPLALCFTILLLLRKQAGGSILRTVAFCGSWSLPLFLFWVSHEAINAREFLCTAPGLALLLALPLRVFPKTIIFPVLGAAWCIGALWVSPTSQTFFPSARLIKSSIMYRDYHRQIRRIALDWAADPAAKKILLGGELTACFQGYLFSNTWQKVGILKMPDTYVDYRTQSKMGEVKEFGFHYGLANSDFLVKAKAAGFQLYASPDYPGHPGFDHAVAMHEIFLLPNIHSYRSSAEIPEKK